MRGTIQTERQTEGRERERGRKGKNNRGGGK